MNDERFDWIMWLWVFTAAAITFCAAIGSG
jgi:hypothetical protein